MSAWLTRLRERPIAERERPWVLALVALALSGATLALALARPSQHYGYPSPSAHPSRSAHEATSVRTASTELLSPKEEQVSRVFLAGYLAYVYRHASAGGVRDATRALTRSLYRDPPRGAPAMEGLDPRVVSLRSTGSSNGTAAVSALVNDGGLIDYRLELHLVHRGSALLVSGVGQG